MIRARNFIFAALMLPQITSAGGSVSWDDVVPLLSQNRKLQSFVEMTFDVVPAGTATRLGKQFENLDGQRVAPYVFSAKPRGSGDGYPFNLVIDAEIQFLDAEGNALDESGAEINAAQIRQVLAGIRLEPVEESEAQAKLSEEIATARTKQIREWFNDINLRDARISAIEFADESVPIEAKAVYHRHPKSGSLELITVDGSLGDHSGFSESFYFMEGELFFVYRQENHWTFHPQNPNSTIDSVKEERFHFYQGAIYEGLAKEYEGGGPEKLQQAQQAAETKPIPLNGSEANRFYSRASRLVIARSPKDCANIYIDVFRQSACPQIAPVLRRDMDKHALGLDYGTNSCRSLLVNLETGAELGSVVFPYPSGELGILTTKDPNVARQNPQDYLDGLEVIIKGAIEQARQADPGFDPASIIGIGIDTTGSTPIPVDAEGTPLGLKPEFRDNLDAMVWLWKDHTGHDEAAKITELAANERPQYLAKCGGIYSSEWWWSKIWRCKNVAPDVFAAAYSWVEHCDWLPAVLTGNTKPETMARGICSAGHKAMYCEDWGGLPDAEFLAQLDPDLAALRDRLYSSAQTADTKAGGLTAEWAAKLGLPEGTAVSVGAFDAHMGAVGAGVKEGTLVKILGTSTCDVTVAPTSRKLDELPGVCGIVDGSVLPGYYGIEAGQSAVGDMFLWFVNNLVPDKYGVSMDEKFQKMEAELSKLKPGETGLLALDWNNGNRTILVDVRLSGLLLGQTLHTQAHEIYRALIEATAFGALTIINRMEEYGVKVDEVINTGGLSTKNATLMQIYADIIGRPLKVAKSDQTCALGAAIFGAVSSGQITIEEAQSGVCGFRDRVYTPDPTNQAVYAEIYELYRTLHDAFGTADWSGKLSHVMKRVIEIREKARAH